jgi:putative ABC transport system ATP-binding protein
MDQATAGKVHFYGKELSQLKDRQISQVRLEEMGFVFQQMYLLKKI